MYGSTGINGSPGVKKCFHGWMSRYFQKELGILNPHPKHGEDGG